MVWDKHQTIEIKYLTLKNKGQNIVSILCQRKKSVIDRKMYRKYHHHVLKL